MNGDNCTAPIGDGHINPYDPPRVDSPSELPANYIRVDGRYLVLGRKAILPARCVVTNEQTTEFDRIGRRLKWAPPLRVVVSMKECQLVYSVNRRRRAARRYWSLGLAVAATVGTFLLGIAHAPWIALTVYLVIRAINAGPLSVRNARDDRFWISGCGRPFLESCEQEFGIFTR